MKSRGVQGSGRIEVGPNRQFFRVAGRVRVGIKQPVDFANFEMWVFLQMEFPRMQKYDPHVPKLGPHVQKPIPHVQKLVSK